MKIINAFNKLNQKMHKNGITLMQVFDAYDVNKDGGVTIKEFSRILKRLDDSMSDEEIKMGFSLVDTDHSQEITFQEFMEYFCKCTGEPVKDYMTMRAGK
jgi:calmodulin